MFSRWTFQGKKRTYLSTVFAFDKMCESLHEDISTIRRNDADNQERKSERNREKEMKIDRNKKVINA